MLRAAGDGRLDAGFGELGLEFGRDGRKVLLALGGPVGDEADDLVVDLGVENLEREVFELPFDRVHAQPVRQRGVDLEGLAGLLRTRGGGDELPRAGIVEAVGEFDDEDADVLGHRDDHLPHGLRLGGLTVGELVELRHPVDHRGDLGAEGLGELLERVVGVLDGVVEQSRRQGDGEHADLGEDRRHRHRVGDVGVPGLPGLTAVGLLGDRVGTDDEVDVGLRMARLQGTDHRSEHPGVVGVVLCPGRPPGQTGDAARTARFS
ncbi:Uncharacterised protein [Mycobacteroides abscessus subsp. abscessus]|nr:Uncharacterised protein [Mycobacteroides abscessus subsp. abscessus]